jgi:hypothetical protein
MLPNFLFIADPREFVMGQAKFLKDRAYQRFELGAVLATGSRNLDFRAVLLSGHFLQLLLEPIRFLLGSPGGHRKELPQGIFIQRFHGR